jgi:hypothetical protein
MKSVAESAVRQFFTLILFSLTFVSIYSEVKAQSCTGCSVTVTVPSSANVNISSGQTVCIVGTGSYTGTLNMNGGTLCIGQGVNYNPSSANYNSTWTIINNGNFQNVNNLNFNGGTTFINNPTGVISFPNDVSFNATFINNGTANFAQDVTINGGSSVQLGGVTTIGDDLKVNGTLTIIGYVQAYEIDINGGGVIQGGNGPGCNYIVATDELDNNGTIGGGSFSLVYSPTPTGNGSIISPAVSGLTLTPPAIQFSGASLSPSGNNIVGTVTNPGGSPAPTHYLVLRRVGSPITVAPTDFVNYTVGGTIGGATIVAINPVSTTSFTDANVLSNGCTTYYYAVFGFRMGSGCAEFNNTITNATFVRAFTAIPGPNLTACQSASPSPITLSGASVTNGASSGAWSIISGGGTLSSTAQTGTPENVTYTPAANYSGSVTLTLTTNSTAGCPAVTATRTITVSQAPTVNAGTTSPVCQSGSPTAIALSGATVGGGVTTAAWSIASGGGTLSSTAQTSTPATVTYTPAANFSGTVTLTLTTASNAGCAATSQNRTITVNAASVATPGTALTACQSASPTALTLSGASVSGGATTGAWSITSGGGSLSSTSQTGTPGTITYTPAANYSGSVTLTLTTNSTAGCPAVTATRTITVSQAPTVNAGTTSPVCQSGSPTAIALSGATVGGGVTTAAWSIASGGGTLSSTAQTSTPATVTYTPAANFSGTVTLTLTTASNAGCAAVSQNRTITVNAASVATPGAALTACQSASPTALTLSGASVSGGATTGAWSITSGGGSLSSTSQTGTPGTITYTPAANYSGSVTLTLTTNSTAGCPAVTATRTITVSQGPTVNAGTTSPVCQSGSPTAIALSGATVGGGVTTAAWSIASGGGTLSSTAQTSTPATVTYTPAANFSGTVTLTLTTASNAGCAATSQNTTITVNAASVATPGAAISNCQPYNSSTPITLSGASVSGGATTGSWSITSGSGTLSSVSQSAAPGLITYTPPVNFNGTVTLLLTSNNAPGCPAVSSSRTLQINTQPQAPTAVNGTGTFCPGNSATLTASGGYIPAGSSWQWFTGGCGNTSVGNGTSITVSPTVTTTYYVRGAAIGACPATACTPAVMSLPNPVNEIVPVTDNTVCVVRENNYVHFYNLSGQIICSINSRGQDLGNVTASVYVDNSSLNIQPCNAPGFFSTAVMGRRWAITPQYQPTSAVDVILYFNNSEFTTLRAAANANNNPLDDLSSITDLTCTKYSNSNASVVNGTWSDNCGGGSAQLVSQSESGNVQTMFSSYSANGRFARYVIGGFSEFWLHGSGTITPLPVRLITFDAQPNGTEVDLTWSTATESNNEKFIIERSADLINWEYVTQTPGAGNSNEVLNYATVDPNPLEGASYYRLTQIDFNGNSETFDPVRVDFASKPVSASVSVYPNPVVDSYTVQLTADAPGERIISLYTTSGSQVSSQRTQVIKGQNKVSASAQTLAAGVYFIRIENPAESKSESFKLVVTRN